jgi:hypothetical protein
MVISLTFVSIHAYLPYIFVSVHVLIACISATSPTYPPVSKQDACDFWQKFTTEMNNIRRVYSYLSYNCTYDTNKCNGADCTGDIKYEVLVLMIQTNVTEHIVQALSNIRYLYL